MDCGINLELEFAKFLDNADDVIAFSIEYLNTKGALRLYIPDLAETKGLEDIEVERKDYRVIQWCMQQLTAINLIAY